MGTSVGMEAVVAIGSAATAGIEVDCVAATSVPELHAAVASVPITPRNATNRLNWSRINCNVPTGNCNPSCDRTLADKNVTPSCSSITSSTRIQKAFCGRRIPEWDGDISRLSAASRYLGLPGIVQTDIQRLYRVRQRANGDQVHARRSDLRDRV